MEKSDTGWICKQINAIKSQNKMWEDTKPYSNSLNTVNKFSYISYISHIIFIKLY